MLYNMKRLLLTFLSLSLMIFCIGATALADQIPDFVRAEFASLEQQYGVKFLIGEDALSVTSSYEVSEYDP